LLREVMGDLQISSILRDEKIVRNAFTTLKGSR
jgi:hypothetical protein